MTETRSDMSRLAAIDWMRGFVMVLMAVDHASQMWNAGRVASDSAYLANLFVGGDYWIPGTELGPAQFVTRWITHLCAPTFLFLSGTSLAMSFEKRRAQGMAERELDRHLLVRAGVVLACEGLLSLMAASGMLMLQVLFAIGASMIAMVLLRRLPTALLVAIGVGWLAGSEFVLMRLLPIPEDLSTGAVDHFSMLSTLLFVPGNGSFVVNSYPMTHWLAMMLLGWAFGRFLLDQPANEHGRQETEKLLLLCGCTALLLWSLIRSQNGYGNMGLLRDDRSVIQFLHMSKYPPALVYSLMELGLMALGLVFCLRTERRLAKPVNPWNPLLVYGQTALFFYMLHFVLLGAGAMAITGGMMLRGLTETWIAAGAVLVVLYPACVWFRRLKRRHPDSFLQYI
ncbi:MAG: heparan-alpha-glucosaminide N-acetyltransferase domain-containing protein [bacterium]|nr:heparan-alpha-glucosaminide N-acetyltransferase domain-containing protein [bacterium]